MNPTEDKYRRLKKTNATLEEKFFKYSNGYDLLKVIGFTDENG